MRLEQKAWIKGAIFGALCSNLGFIVGLIIIKVG